MELFRRQARASADAELLRHRAELEAARAELRALHGQVGRLMISISVKLRSLAQLSLLEDIELGMQTSSNLKKKDFSKDF